VAETVLDPAHILQVATGFFGSKTLLSAAELGLFTVLDDDPSLSGDQIGKRLNLHPRAIDDFLDSLVALGFLERTGDGVDGRYSNTPETAAFLSKHSPRYVGGMLEMLNARLFGFWNDLTEALHTGQPQNELKQSGHSMFEEVYADPARLEQFLLAMQGISTPNFEALASRFDFSGCRTLCDVGGANGQLSIVLAERHPHLQLTSLDLPSVTAIAEKTVAAAGLSDRIRCVSGDCFADPLPKADVITMGMILHDWNLDRKMHLIRSAYEALPDGGAFIVVENLIDDARRQNAFGLLMSLNMLIEFGDGFDYTGADFARWCREVGFRQVDIKALAGPASAGIAYK
jgi:predicted O-methyltransferase YrrM